MSGLRSLTCESCFDRMWMTPLEYRTRAAGGWLVYCDHCKPNVRPRRVSSRASLPNEKGQGEPLIVVACGPGRKQ